MDETVACRASAAGGASGFRFSCRLHKFIRNQLESEPYPSRKSRSLALHGLASEFGGVLQNSRARFPRLVRLSDGGERP